MNDIRNKVGGLPAKSKGCHNVVHVSAVKVTKYALKPKNLENALCVKELSYVDTKVITNSFDALNN